MRRILAQARKELTQIVRDWRTLVLALALPLVLLMLMGNAISLTVNHLPIIVQDFDDSPASHEFLDAFRASITFHVVPWTTDQQPEEAFASNRARAAIIIPVHFGRDLARGISTPVQLLVDGSDANTAKLISGYAARSRRLTTSAQPAGPGGNRSRRRSGCGTTRDAHRRSFTVRGFSFSPCRCFRHYWRRSRCQRRASRKRFFRSTSRASRRHEFLLGKILAFMTVALAECLIMLTLLFTYFGLRLAGDPMPFIVATLLYAFCVASFGTMVGAAIPNQAAAMQAVALGGFLLVFLLSGLIFPVENIPGGLRWLSHFIWGRYYIEIVRDALLQGGGWPATWFQVLIIGLIGAIFYTLAWRSMRRMQLKA